MKFAASVSVAVTFLWLLAAVGAGPVVIKRVVREARPQFPFGGIQNAPNAPPNGIGVQTPIGGFHLGLSTGLTLNLGRRPADPAEAPEVQVPPELQSVGVPSIGDEVGIRSEETPASVAPPASEAPVTELSEDHPCAGYDPNQAAAANATTDDSSTANPCAGIGGGNRISPKQAALLSLVG
ncbi:uncharacterized protein LOC128274029 [Anopheles cruzii]|uniref:uncharacterized protein LOC128274029 n=1 Tax=Anopheles cruzii TaxID=68878 RepID=UPI0022EC8EE3|nr:uncharacterized protein LOC128274029 [Anopheles cruzii]